MTWEPKNKLDDEDVEVSDDEDKEEIKHGGEITEPRLLAQMPSKIKEALDLRSQMACIIK